MFIRGEIKYSLPLFEETNAGARLKAYARSLSHREHTPPLPVFSSISNPPRLFRKIRQDSAGARPLSFDEQTEKENRTH
jgi:hypothetical protein